VVRLQRKGKEFTDMMLLGSPILIRSLFPLLPSVQILLAFFCNFVIDRSPKRNSSAGTKLPVSAHRITHQYSRRDFKGRGRNLPDDVAWKSNLDPVFVSFAAFCSNPLGFLL
jgi:hypothetical protein